MLFGVVEVGENRVDTADVGVITLYLDIPEAGSGGIGILVGLMVGPFRFRLSSASGEMSCSISICFRSLFSVCC